MSQALTAEDVLTIEEIERLYPDEWVLLVDLVLEPGPVLLGGRVVFHNPDRDVMYDKMLELRPAGCASHYTGLVTGPVSINLSLFGRDDP